MIHDHERRLTGESPDVARLEREARDVLAEVDAVEREVARLGEMAAREAAECSRVEAEAENLLRRVLVAAERLGDEELRAHARRELSALKKEA